MYNIIMEQTKTKCNGCRCWREPADFIKNDKVVKSCIICREYREKNKDKITERNQKYRSENADKVKEYQQKYHSENADKVKEKQKKYYAENIDRIKQYRSENADKISEKQQKYYAENADKVKEKQQKYYAENVDKISEKHKQYRSENADKINEQHKQSYVEQKHNEPLKLKLQTIVYSSKSSDKIRTRTYNEEDYITYEFLMSLYEGQQGKCYYENCNCDMTLDFNKSCRTPTQISIQRLDNEIAHIKSNCVLSCYFCNCVKRMENYIE